MTTPTSGSGGSAGLLSAYASTTTPTLGEVLATVTVPSPGWYDVEVQCWNNGTTGVIKIDDANIGLYSDAVTAASMVFQRLIAWNCFLIAATNPPITVRTRVYVQSTINLQAMAAGTSGAIYVCNLTAAPTTQWNADI